MIPDSGHDYEPRICQHCTKEKCTEVPSECEAEAMEAAAERKFDAAREDRS